MTNEQHEPEDGQVSETTGLDEDRVQDGIQGEGEPPSAAVRSQDRGPDEDPSDVPEGAEEPPVDRTTDELSAADRAAKREEG